MINIVNKKDCVGCEGCVQICPKNCISFDMDTQGFGYPKVDLNRCIKCNLCDRVCPVINQSEEMIPLKIYSATNLNEEVLKDSSSGGVFFAIAKEIINSGGVVFGARYSDNWEVIHDYTETIEGLKVFQGSKYVQSRIGNTYKNVLNFLKSGRKVLFTGTPCQIAGLRLYLRNEFKDLLLCVDIICHGVPSPRIWREYLHDITCSLKNANNNDSKQENRYKILITSISFRNKREGWENSGFSVDYTKQIVSNKTQSININLYEKLDSNAYFWSFNSSLTLRPSCFFCPAKCGKSLSDLTIGDFWHVKRLKKESYHKGGVSLVLVNSDIGLKYINENLSPKPTTYDIAKESNPALINSIKCPKRYKEFWNNYNVVGIKALYIAYEKRISFTQKYLKKPLKAILGKRIINIIRNTVR